MKNIILGVLGVIGIMGIVVLVAHFYEVRNVPKSYPDPVLPIENPVNDSSEFNTSVSLKLNQEVTFTDGLVVKLKEINDSRCPADVQCIWAGEISGTLEIYIGQPFKVEEVHIGTVNNKRLTVEGYTFSLQDATKDKITLLVQQN